MPACGRGPAGAGGRAACQPPFFVDIEQRGADVMIAVKHSRHQGFQVIRDRLSHGRKAPLQTRMRECKRGRDGKPVDQTRYDVTSLRTSARALLQHVRDRWSIENSWHWPHNTQLKEKAHRYRELNGVQIMATLRSLAMNALRLDGFCSITEGLAALAHDIRG